jgi:ATPase subunit of ABC transporter with duplicated ATPase domains
MPWRLAMSDEAVNETAEVTTTEVTNTEDTVPEWVREKLTKANNEAAKYRTKAKEAAQQAQFEAEEKFSAQIAALTDEKAAAVAELENARLEATKLKAALSVGIPGESASEFADLLKGTNEEEILAHAEKVKELFGASVKPARATDPTQGLDGGNATAQSAGAMLANFIRGN